ncbi:DUF4440 domain-containing protein [Sphingomonas sp.]|uniref:YybH family protein n=1 Tax=Sphingomonas sp. TaxID=28214 RepID=UPI00286CDECD|nr:DUF4440 domain-containing protein [Sphingomonas sp.]
MTSRHSLLKFSLVSLLAFGSDASTASPSRSIAPRAAYDLQTGKLEAFFRTRTQDGAALRSIYTREAILVEADGNIIRGRDAIARHFKQILASGAVVSFKVTTTTFRTQGEISYAGGYEDIEVKSVNGSRRNRNRFFDLLRREPDGVWRFDYIMEAR